MSALPVVFRILTTPLLSLLLVVGSPAIVPSPALACGPAAATDLFCLGGGILPPGFGDTFRNNLVDPLGGQCLPGTPGCAGDTFSRVDLGECTDGSTACGNDLLGSIPVSSDPCISCFAEPGNVRSLIGGDDRSASRTEEYLAERRKTLAFQEASYRRAEEGVRKARKERQAAERAVKESEKRIGFLEKDLKIPTVRDNPKALSRTLEALKAEKEKLRKLESKARALKRLEEIANKSASLQAEIIGTTKEEIARATTRGDVPAGRGSALTQFTGGTAVNQSEYRYKSGENSSYNQLVAGGKGFSFETDPGSTRTVDWRLVRPDVGSQFVRSTSGHAADSFQGDRSAGTSNAYEQTAGLFGLEAYRVTHHYMVQGLYRNLRDAVRRGEIPGTIEVVPGEDGQSERHVVRIPPEGLEAAKRYLDVLDSLIEGVSEDSRTTKTDRQRADEEAEADERDRRLAETLRRNREKNGTRAPAPKPVPAKDLSDNLEPDDLDRAADDLQKIFVPG